VTDLSITEAFVGGGETLIISGSSFQTSGKVLIGGKECEVTSYSDTSVECILPASSPGDQQCLVIRDDGYSSQPRLIQYVLQTTSVDPTEASFAGGVTMTLSGKFYGTNSSVVDVIIGSNRCKVLSVQQTEIKCEVPTSAKTISIDNSGVDNCKFFSLNPINAGLFRGSKIAFTSLPPF